MEFSSLRRYTRLKWLIPICSAGVLTAFSLVPADDWQDKVTNALALFGKRFPQEKVYLHLDKDFYASGETIWFKAYVMIQNQPSLTASNLYVELLDKEGNVVMKKHLPAAGAAAAGDFELPETLKTGQYQIRAYTAWMTRSSCSTKTSRSSTRQKRMCFLPGIPLLHATLPCSSSLKAVICCRMPRAWLPLKQ